MQPALGAHHDRPVDHPAVELEGTLARRRGCLDHPGCPGEFVGRWPEPLIQDRDLRRMNDRGTPETQLAGLLYLQSKRRQILKVCRTKRLFLN